MDAPLTNTPDDDLPVYAGANAHFTPTDGIDSVVPPEFSVAQNIISPLVLPSDLQAHLLLLGAFRRLREEVRTQNDVAPGAAEKWTVFLARAVYRFELWVTKVIDTRAGKEKLLAETEIPPLDAVLVWHTYMLQPRNYYEDTLRKFRGLYNLGSFPLRQLAGLIDPVTFLPYPPSESRAEAFATSTGLDFQSSIVTSSSDVVPIACPQCSQINLIAWLADDGAGYAQPSFKLICEHCKELFNKETIAAKGFYTDVEKCIFEPDANVLANTLVDYASGMPEEDLSKQFTNILIHHEKGNPIPKPQSLTFKSMEAFCRVGFLNKKDQPYIETPRPVNIVLSAYRHLGPFSIDLASAVIRQMTFVDKVVQMGWTKPDRFSMDGVTLSRAVIRYHHFLDLLSSTPGRFAVPTLDIDLAWHTHQLLCDSYRTLYNIIGWIPDHDDTVAQDALATAYDDTAVAWKAKFKSPYSVCGCAPPPKALGSATKSLFSRKTKGSSVASNYLVSTSDDDAPETHPSEHNSVVVTKTSGGARRHEMGQRLKNMEKAIDKGKLDDWAKLQAKRAEGHQPSFVDPGVDQELAPVECTHGAGTSALCGVSTILPRTGLQNAVNHAMLMGATSNYQAELGRAYAATVYPKPDFFRWK